MKLRLIFEGDEPISIKMVSDVLATIDKRLFAYEKKRLKQLPDYFPVTKEQVLVCLKALNDEYKAKQFTMLEVETVSKGSFVFLAGVRAAGFWILEKTLGATVSEAWKESGLHRKIKRFFIDEQGTSLTRAVEDTAFKFNKTDAVKRLVDKNQIERINFPSFKWGSLEVSLGHVAYSKLDAPLVLTSASPAPEPKPRKMSKQPTECYVFRDMQQNESNPDKPTLDVFVQRIVVKVPPISYGKLVDQYNKGEGYRGETDTLNVDE